MIEHEVGELGGVGVHGAESVHGLFGPPRRFLRMRSATSLPAARCAQRSCADGPRALKESLFPPESSCS
jgi:hypothetical protein